MSKVAVVLSGCGVKDGSEIHEAVSALIALDQAGARIVCCAPDIPQAEVINHVEDVPLAGETRRVLVESARIARGEIKDLARIHADSVDAAIFPGGLGAAKNWCTYADAGAECEVNCEVARFVGEMLEAGKPIGAICIAPAAIARIAGMRGVKLNVTIGNAADVAQSIREMGCDHTDCAVTDCVVDEANKVVTTPAYMLAQGPAQVFAGIGGLVKEVLRLAGA